MSRRLETQEYVVPLYRWCVCVCVYMWTDMMHYFELKDWCGFLQNSISLDANTLLDIVKKAPSKWLVKRRQLTMVM